MARITLVGLGPGDPMLLTRAAWEALQQAEVIYTPVPEHGALAEFAAQNKIRSFEVLAGGDDDIEACTDMLYTLAQEQGTLCCALPGNPLDARLTTGLVLITEVEEVSTLSVDIIAGVGMVDAVRGDFSVGNGGLQFWSFHEDLFFLGSREAVNYRYHPNNEQFVRPWCEVQGIADYAPLPDWSALTPSLPAVIWIEKLSDAALLQEYLLEMSPANTPLSLLQHDYKGRQKNKQVTLGFLAESIAAMWDPQQVISVWVPGDIVLYRRTFESLHAVVVRLLGPGGCPWDVQQTHQSLRANLLEEVYEVLEALDSGDMAALAEELGDLLMQVLVHSEMARQAGHFAIGDVLEQIHTKLVRRHPHVFDDTPARDESEVLSNWEQIKAHERAARGREHASSLDGVPAALPALAASQKTGKKAARAGFDWPTVEGARAKLREELAELDHAYQAHQQQASDASHAHLTEELGDMLYALAQVARWLDVDAESALREATAKFRRRFVRLEQTVQAEGRSLHKLSLEEKVAYWNRARRQTG